MHVQLAPLGSKNACADASSSASAVALAGTIAVVIMQPTARHRYHAFPADRAFAARESKDLVKTYIRNCTTSSTGGAYRIGGGSHRPSPPPTPCERNMYASSHTRTATQCHYCLLRLLLASRPPLATPDSLTVEILISCSRIFVAPAFPRRSRRMQGKRAIRKQWSKRLHPARRRRIAQPTRGTRSSSCVFRRGSPSRPVSAADGKAPRRAIWRHTIQRVLLYRKY